MDTVFKSVTKDDIENEGIIKEAAGIIKRGGVLIFPTETVYGVGADAFNEKACRRIYEIKNRPAHKPLIVLISYIKDVDRVASDVPDEARNLMEKYWPGPLSIILKKNEDLPDVVTAGTDTVAVRLTSNEVLRKIISEAECPIVAPSANISGKPFNVRAKDTVQDFEGLVDMIVEDDGSVSGVESTIVYMCGGHHKLIREGAIPATCLSFRTLEGGPKN